MNANSTARTPVLATRKLIVIAMAVSLASGLAAGAGTMAVMKATGTAGDAAASSAMGSAPGGQGGMGGADTMSYDYAGTYSGALAADGSAETSSGETVTASNDDQNAALAQNGGTLTVTGGTLAKSGNASSDDNANFYGTNSIALAVGDGSTLVLDGTKLTASGSGSNGVFATDSATALVRGATIATTADNSRGLDATYGGTILAGDVTASTQGDHSATVATDRGGGSVSLVDSTIATAGSGSPLLYSTGDVQAYNVTGTASGSQIAGMEGYNTILIKDSTLKSTNTGKTGSDPIANGVIIYQSTSGDAESSTGEHATFQAVDSTLTSAIESGSMFYFTNTTADVVLSNTTLNFDTTKATLINASGNDSNNWGSTGSNGATVTFTGRSQTLEGDVTADTISSVDLYLLEGSTWTGSASIAENASAASGSTSEAPITVNVDATSTWVVTGDTTVSALNVASGGRVVDASGRTVTIVAGGKTVVSGTSGITVTVTGAYSTSVEAGGDTELADETIDRSAYDEQFGTSTSWSM
ncbi:beta strand repeat-containing protein [Bifidobacterium avesanii]|uniref:Adhesin n=1 Tax=Bifidobacterium avesanii TaxID=1798157 RepID=A0A7K3THE6_9BIFI|nr:adhesin [Bifidobacterium avesanii]KAB8295658.1 adhesin [Bifidobacterium avesanii]NEG77663.1 adhesin [Bifidobacterium avesanii]